MGRHTVDEYLQGDHGTLLQWMRNTEGLTLRVRKGRDFAVTVRPPGSWGSRGQTIRAEGKDFFDVLARARAAVLKRQAKGTSLEEGGAGNAARKIPPADEGR